MSVRNRVLESKELEITQIYKAGVHNGIDVVNKNYTLGYICSHSDGVVVDCRDGIPGFVAGGSYGNFVKIKHDNGYYTLYAHLSNGTVVAKSGQRVSKGQRLGYMGNTGTSYGGHLHFEVRNEKDVRIDPTPYLNADLPSVSDSGVNIFYKVKTQKHGWLPEVRNLEDYAGWEDSPIIALAVRVDKGSIKYRAHIKGGNWLPYVTGYDVNNFENGYAGDDRIIDAVEIYYYTPSDIRPFKKAKYKINNYDWQYDNEKTNNQDGYAGVFGVPATKLQITIE